MQEKTHCVYMHINKVNGKKYIGQAKGNPKNRWNKGYKNCTVFYNAIQKYGWNNFEHIVLVNGLTIDEANLCEQIFIALYDTTNRKLGYNLQSGGKNCNQSKETKLKISNSNIGKHKNFGKNNYFYGKTHTLETREYLRKINTGKKHSAKTIEKMIANSNRSHKGINHPNIKPISQFDKNNNFIADWQYINQARDYLGIDPSTIIRCCKGKQKTAGGFVWKYKGE